MVLNIHQKIGLFTVFTLFMGLFYEQLFHLLWETGHILFEITEYVLDSIIDNLFEISTHKTQIVVFYTLLIIIFYTIYRFYRWSPRFLNRIKQFWQRQKTETLAQWQELTLLWKVTWSSSFLCLVVGFFLT